MTEHKTTVSPAAPQAEALARALMDLLDAERRLATAKATAPRYTGQWSRADFYAEEQEARNRAVDAYAAAIKGVMDDA